MHAIYGILLTHAHRIIIVHVSDVTNIHTQLHITLHHAHCTVCRPVNGERGGRIRVSAAQRQAAHAGAQPAAPAAGGGGGPK